MDLFSYHLLETTLTRSLRTLGRPPVKRTIAGLHHAETMTVMRLGEPIFSLSRMQLRQFAIFASWEDEGALENFLTNTHLGQTLATGWHIRLRLLRRWGRFPEFDHPIADTKEDDPNRPVVAVTVARLKLSEVFRFVRWGRPVETQVRDHPGTTLALASFRPPGTFSTFSVWRSQREMLEMVHGLKSTSGAQRHAEAMNERNRKDFHHAFTTLRFQPISEHGKWAGRTQFVPS